MIKKIKHKLRKINNHGSSFVLVIVSTTFLSILVSALLLGAMLAYKLKFYKVNSLNNFYSVEKAMDEIYAGIGATTNEYLYLAYTTTAELVVVYDDVNKEYKNLDNDEANELFKKLFMRGITTDNNYKEIKKFADTLQTYISDDSVTLDTTNMQIVFQDENGKCLKQYFKSNGKATSDFPDAGFDAEKIEKIFFKNICVKRSITMSSSEVGTTAGTYEQSITTDIVLVEPEYNVSFDMASSSTDSLYNYAILADMGIEVDDATTGTDVFIKGNIYAASDYYNKEYNAAADKKVTEEYDKAKTTTWGSTNNSAYSGIYVDGENTSLTMNSDVIVCSGALAAFNGSDISLSGRSSLLAELWADNIIIAGTKGGNITAAANAYIYDDTELNAEQSSLTFTKGRYFGYSYAADDIRSVNLLRTAGYLATGYELKSHFSDSAVIVNGKGSTLNFKNLDSLYIAGKSYIEFSKIAASTVNPADTSITVDKDADFAFTSLKDYSTGQSLDVKSNQLIFLTQWEPVANSEKKDADTGITTVKLRFPSTFAADTTMRSLYQDFLDSSDQITAIKQTVSGHDYYYLYIEAGDSDGDGISNAEEFAEKYYDMFNSGYGDAITGKLYNVANYEEFEVKLVMPSTGNTDIDTSLVNADGAVTYQKADDSLFYKSSAETTLNVDTALKNAASSKTFTMLLGNKGDTENNLTYENLRKASADLSTNPNLSSVGGRNAYTSEQRVSNFLTYMYINMKDHLGVTDKVDETTKLNISAWDIAGYSEHSDGKYFYNYNKNNDSYSYDYSITPLHNYVNYPYIFTHNVSINETVGDSLVIVNKGDVTLSTSNDDGLLQGIVIATGNVTFDKSVKSFRGLIITGSKLKCHYDVTLSADATYVAKLLQSCAESTDEDINLITKEILLKYQAVGDDSSATVTGSSISDISYQDILVFENWKKNVE